MDFDIYMDIFMKKYIIPNGTKVVVHKKVSNFNHAGEMDKWIGQVMTVRRYDNMTHNYQMEEDISECDSQHGWHWIRTCIIPVADLIKNTNITEEEFLKVYYEDLKKNPETRIQLGVKFPDTRPSYPDGISFYSY